MRSFAGDADLTRRRASRRPRPLAPAVRARRPLTSLSGVGPKLAEAAAEAGHRHPRRPADALPAQPPRPHGRAGRRAWSRATAGRFASRCSAARRGRFAAGSVDHLGQSRRRLGHVRASWFNQPWVAPKLTPGRRCCSPAPGTNAVSGSRNTRSLPCRGSCHGGGGRCGPAVLDPPPCATRGRGGGGSSLCIRRPSSCKAQRIRQWVEQAIGWRRTWSRRCRRSCGRAGAGRASPTRSSGALPGERGGSRGGASSGLRSKSCSSTRRFWQVAGGRERVARPAPRMGRARGAGGRLDRVVAVRADRGVSLKAFDEIDGDLDSGEPMQRLLMGEVGSGKTVVALYSMLRALEAGSAGGADGADGDAGRAARGDPRAAAGARKRSRSRC